MANEITVNGSLQIKDGSSVYRSQPTSFKADITGTFRGPAPGAFLVSTAGTDCDLSQFTTPGVARFMNQDDTYTVEYGIRDPATDTFYPLGEIQPGESYILRLSRNIQEDYNPSTGTATTGDVNKLHFKAIDSPVYVLAEIFEA